MCCNGSKKAVPQLHAVASTWSSCVELPVQRLFMGLCADMGLTIYGGDATDAYAHSPAPTDTYLAVDDAYADWYYKKNGEHISKRMILPVCHALQGHPESGKMWMKMIDEILITQLGFRTTTHDRCIYIRERDGEVQLLLRQIDNFCTGMTSEKAARDLFNDIGIKIQFPSEKEDGTIPFEFLGVVTDYNGVDIIQTPDYIEMSCKNYILRLLKSHGWDTPSTTAPPIEDIALPKDAIPPDSSHPTVAAAASVNKLQELQHHGVPILKNSNIIENEGDSCINSSTMKSPATDFMHTSKPSSPLPSDCIDQMYSEEGPLENTTAHLALEKKKGFNYRTLLGELMYAHITCRPDIGYAVTTLSKFSSAPTEFHYKLLKGVAKYLRNTAEWGIRF